MKYVYLLCLMLLLPQIASAQEASLPWFSGASITGSTHTTKPVDALSDSEGTLGNGVSLTRSVGIDNPLLIQQRGIISFWIKPNWNGNDGLTHKLLKIGNPSSNGLLVEKSAQNTLRFVMASATKTTATRTDVSNWIAGKWHQVVISWNDSSNKPLGIALWIDKICVSSTVFSGDSFMNPATMTDKKVYIGDTTSDAVMDELIFRGNTYSSYDGAQLGIVYRDYFRTAPFTAIKIDAEPNLVKSDKRVVNGAQKQFGLMALMEGNWVRITDFAVRYGNWGDFDAKPFITWNMSNNSIATVESSTYRNGRVTGIALGTTTLSALFRGMSATYDVEVISPEQPDIDLMYVERTPKYSRNATKKWPATNDNVTSIAHIGNYGYTTLPAGTVVKFELIPDNNKNFKVDPEEEALATVQTTTINVSMAPGTNRTVNFNWKWPSIQTFVRVTADPDNKVGEICEANNQRCELNNARAFHWGYNTQWFSDDYSNRHVNLVGSFSDYDWCTSETDRMERVMRESVLPTTSPYGIRDSIRVDQFTARVYGNWEDEPWEKEGEYYDGGFPDMEPQNSTVMDIDAAIGHEIGHTTIWLPDIYGYPYKIYNVFLKDENGQPYAGTKLYPSTMNPDWGPLTSAYYDYPDSLGLGYSTLMVDCHLWLDQDSAGLSDSCAQSRSGIADHQSGYFLPTDNRLQLFDINDQPLNGAAVYVYQVNNNTGVPDSTPKYIPERAKYIGNTDSNGYYLFPKKANSTWDDPDTDTVEGAMSTPNPYQHALGVPWSSSWTNGECLIFKIVSGNQTEFQWLPLSEVNNAYMRGEKTLATYPIRTSLTSTGVTPTITPVYPIAIQSSNRKPVAVVPAEIHVKPGDQFTIDGSSSFDPEGMPLIYRWLSPTFSTEPVLHGYAPWAEGEYDYTFYVIDGLRISDIATTKLIVEQNPPPPPPVPGKVTGKVSDLSGNPVDLAVVGLKTSPFATADADYYAVTDSNGSFSFTADTPSGSYYLAAWKDGFTPTTDTVIDVQDNLTTTKNLRFDKSAGSNMVQYSPSVSASSSSSSATLPCKAVDAATSAGWTANANSAFYYIDLRKPTDISDIVIYRYNQLLGSGLPFSDNFKIDVMASGDPLIGSSWQNNPSVQTIYSANQTLHGYLSGTTCIDPIRLSVTGIRGIRIGFNSSTINTTEISEVQIHSAGSKPIVLTGRVLNSSGISLGSNTLVGIKTDKNALADALGYVVTDSNDSFKISGYPGETFYLAGWRPNYRPSKDLKIVLPATDSSITDVKIGQATTKISSTSLQVSATSSIDTLFSKPSKAIDSFYTTAWTSAVTPTSPVYYYINLGKATNVDFLKIYRNANNADIQCNSDDYQIDFMTAGNPSDPASWANNPSVHTVYSAAKSTHGQAGYNSVAAGISCVRFSPFDATGIIGMRLTFKNSALASPAYSIYEIEIYPTNQTGVFSSITDLKINAADNVLAIVKGNQLTYLPGGLIPGTFGYMEASNRSSGIRLNLQDATMPCVNTGDKVDVAGTVSTSSNGERMITVDEMVLAAKSSPLRPLFTNTRYVGGGDLGRQQGVWAYVRNKNTDGTYSNDFQKMTGLNNLGLLIKTYGKVTYIDPSGAYFYMDDGAKIYDGYQYGVRVALDGRAYTVGQRLTITGISSCFLDGPANPKRQILPISISTN